MVDQVIGVTIKGIGDFSDVVSNVGNVQKALTKLKLPDKLGDNLNKNISNFMKEYDKYQKKIAEGIHTQGDQNAVNKSLNSMLNSYEKIIKDFGKISPKDFKEIFNLDDSAFVSVQKRIKEIQAEIKKIKLDPKQLTDPINEISKLTKANSLFGNGKAFDKLKQAFASNEIQDAKEAIADIQTYYDRFSAKMSENKRIAFLDEFNKLKGYVNNADQATQKWSGDLDRLEKELGDIGGKGLGEIDEMKQKLLETSQAAERVTDVLKKQHAEEFNFNREAQNIDRQIQSYFGLSQMIRKVGDIAKDAFATVKELDAAMTQTAVVTNFSVGDMWDMLPTYTAQANQLGSTIKDVYEAATLYYQQGLNTNQAMGLANETLKMARIAGLDAAEATNMMTAALRGFNMEINQMSAQKVNDIYSELAAITASDTAEIGSAMERTASIANSANMEFATTSAFLAQMIETTREAPENLGTAMKTIVARFQEMKQDPTKLIDSEGVAMDANKVDKALKTIGVNLMNTKGEFRDLDDVFLDIASKWDSLSQGQQRYIATIAAGSRQQSRFIAMMSDYERTMELVDAANNSAGASQRQFEKTLDSMEAKLNMLKNAWDQFTMGLMNNQILKFGVDALTEGFTIVNKFIDILGKLPPKPFEGITKSVLTLVTTLGMLNFGKKASRGLIMGGAGWWKGETSLAGGFVEGWKSSGQTGFLKNRKTTAEAEQQGNKDGQAYGRGWTKAIQVLQNQRRGEILGVGQIELNKIQALPVGSIIEKLLPKEAISAEAAQQLQESIDAAGGNVHQGLVDYKHATGKGKILDVNQGKQLQAVYDSNKIKQLETNFNSLTGTIGTAGSALMNFGMVLQGTPLEPFGQILTTIGGSLMSLSVAITTVKAGFLEQWAAATEAALGTTVAAGANGELAVSSIVAAGGMKVLGTAIWTALWPLLAVAAAIGAVVLVAKGLDAAIETNKERLEAASDAAAAASEAYDSAKQETSELADSIDTIRETDSAFDGLVAGTAEFNEQLVTANEQIMALIDKYPMFNDSQYLSTDKNGLMHINEAGFKAVQEYQKQIQARASAMNLIQTADLNALENQQKAQQLRNSIKTNMSDDEQERILRNADLLEQRAEAETKLAHLNAIRTNLVGKEIADQEKLASIYVDQYEAKKQVAEAEVEAMGKHDIRQAYADYHGYTYDKSTKKIKDVEGNEIDYDDAAIKDEVIEQTVMLDFEANASSLEGILHSLDRDFSKTLDGAFENSSNFISDVLSNNIEANEDLLQQVLDNPQQLNDFVEGLSTKELAAVLGASEETVESNISSYKQQLEDKLLANARNIIDTNAQANGELAAMLAQAQGKNADEILDNKNIQDNLIQQVRDFTSEQRNTLLNIGKTLEESAGSETMTTFVNGLSNIYRTGSEELKTVTQDWVDSVNWETATGRLKGYNEAINITADDTKNLGEEGVKQINDLGKALIESQDEANLLGEAFEEFYNSTDFQEMAENMDKFVDSSGQLNAASVMDMAKECHSLNNLLDTGAISAGGVAAALNALGSSGDLVLSDLNSRVLELLSNFGQLDDIIASSHRNIENFDWGIDTGEAEDFVKESAEKWNELYNNGEVGNPQMEAYAKWVMGEDKYIALLADKNGDLQKTMAEVSKYVNKYSEGFTEAWDDLANGEWKDVNLSDNLKDLGISASFNDDGSWHWEPGKATTAELQQWLQEVKGIGPELAQAMIEDWSNYSPNFRAERQKNDFAAGLDSYVEQRRGANGEVAITASELNTIVASTGQKVEDVKAAIAERAGIDLDQVEILENINKNTGEYVTDGAVLNKELTEAVGARGQNGWLAEYQARDSAGNLMKNTIDIESAMAAAVERGYTAAQAKSMAYESYTNAAQQGKDYYYKGELLEADQYKTLDQFAARLEEIDQNEQWTTVGQAMADGFLNRMATLSKPEESALTGGKSEESSTSNIPKGTTIPGIGYVTTDGKVSSRELTWEDRVPGWVSNLIHALENPQPAEEPKEKAYEDASAANKAFMDWFLGKNSEGDPETQKGLQEAGSKLQEGSTQITNAASKLEGAASKLDTAASTLMQNNSLNSSNSSVPNGTTIPGVGFVESNTQTTDVNYDVKVANGEEIRASVQEQLASILKSVTSTTQKTEASASIKVNYAKGKQAKASNQSAKVDYKRGKQDKAEDKEAKVNYTLGTQAPPTSPKTAVVNYTLGTMPSIPDQTVNIYPKLKGSGTYTVTASGATGINNRITSSGLFSLGSLAKGTKSRYGQVGPRNNGGLTLTGEKGFEIAWIPSENRSMIVGANGPQMLNLPKDAVVWTHEQSKKILKQKSIPAGSHSDRPRPNNSSGGDSGGDSGKGSGKGSNKGNNNNNNTDKKIEKFIAKAGKVTVWWENQVRKVEKINRLAEKNQKKFETTLKDAASTIRDARKAAIPAIKRLNQFKDLNEQSRDKATNELKALDNSSSKKVTTYKSLAKGTDDTKRTKKLQKALNKAGFSVDKNGTFGDETEKALKAFQTKKGLKATGKTDKKTIKALGLTKSFKQTKTKGPKTLVENGGSWAEISYERTKKTTENGKTKKTKETKNTKVDLSNYIRYDPATNTYLVDQNEIDKVAKKNKSKATAIKDAANKAIDDKSKKRETAQDNIDKANEAIQKIGQDIYDTFYGWKNELTKVYNITQKLEAIEKRRQNLSTGADLIKAQLAAGKITLDTAKKQTQILSQGEGAARVREIKLGTQQIKARRNAVKNSVDADYNKKIRTNLQKSLAKDDKYDTANKKISKAKKQISSNEAAKKQKEDEIKALKNQLKITKDSKARAALQDKIAKDEASINKINKRISKNQNIVSQQNQNLKKYKKSNLTKDERDEREAELAALKQENKVREKAMSFSSVSTNPDGSVNLEIDYNKIEKARVAGDITTDMASKITDYLENIQNENNGLLDEYNSQTNRLTELYQSLADLKQQQANHAEELFNQYVENQRQEVENAKILSDAISDAFKDLIDTVKNKLEERRRQEDNVKTEQDISKKQQRLAALRANTSGGNQVEIKQLQKEINEAQQSYGRTLEDQLIDKLSQQGDEAAKQREQQIELARAQIEINRLNGTYAAHIDWLLEHPNKKSAEKELKELWNQIMDTKGMPKMVQEMAQSQINQNLLEVKTYKQNYSDLNTEIIATKTDLNYLKTALQDAAEALVAFAGKTYGLDLSSPALKEQLKAGEITGAQYQKKTNTDAKAIQKTVNNSNLKQSTMGNVKATVTKSNGETEKGQLNKAGTKVAAAKGSTLEVSQWNAKKGEQGKFDKNLTVDKFTEKTVNSYPAEVKEALKYAIQHKKPGTLLNKNWEALIKKTKLASNTGLKLTTGNTGYVADNGDVVYASSKKDGVYRWKPGTGKLNFETYNKADFVKKAKYVNVGAAYKAILKRKGVKGYATGGIADFTGPAWLDGTPSKPELVLNPADTKNFLILRDVLDKAIKSTNFTASDNSTGDILYEININVDKIEKDYDVDRVVEKVKKEIVKGAGYRNVTQVRNFR